MTRGDGGCGSLFSEHAVQDLCLGSKALFLNLMNSRDRCSIALMKTESDKLGTNSHQFTIDI